MYLPKVHMEVKGSRPRDYMNLFNSFPLYFHTTIIPHMNVTFCDIFTFLLCILCFLYDYTQNSIICEYFSNALLCNLYTCLIVYPVFSAIFSQL